MTAGELRSSFSLSSIYALRMLGLFLVLRSLAEIREIFAALGAEMLAGKLDAPVAEVYPIERIAEAVAHAQRDAKGGKILVAPNGDI